MQLKTPNFNRIILLTSFIVFLIFLFFRVVFIFYPHPSAAGTDNNIVYFIQRLLDGGILYTNPARPPFAIAQYSPLYYYAVAGVCRMAGLGPDDVLRIFEVSKSFSLFLNFLLSGVLFFTARKIFLLDTRKSWFLSLLTFIFIEGNSFARPDSLDHLFFFLSLYFFFWSVKKKEAGLSYKRELVLSAVIAVFALFSKQSAITLPIICIAWFFMQRERTKRIITYSLAYVLMLTVFFTALHFSTGIKAMYQNAVLGLDNGFHPESYWLDIVVNFYSWFGCLWVFCFLGVYFLLRNEKNKIYHFLAFALLVQLLFTNLFAIKYGSTSNYFTNWWTLLFIGIVVYWQKFSTISDAVYKHLSSLVLLSFLLLKTALIIYPIVDKIKTMPQRKAFFEAEMRLSQQVRSYADSSGQIVVFCNVFSPDSFLNNILFREAIVPQYDVVSLASYPRKVFNYDLLRSKLKDGSVQVLITKNNNKAMRFMDIDLTHYVFSKTEGEYTIYLYTKPSNTINPN